LNNLQHIRESWSVIPEESKIVAANLGFEERFKERDKGNKRFFMMKIEEIYMSMLQWKTSFELK